MVRHSVPLGSVKRGRLGEYPEEYIVVSPRLNDDRLGPHYMVRQVVGSVSLTIPVDADVVESWFAPPVVTWGCTDPIEYFRTGGVS
jgi:hypothetical protein